MRDRWEPTPYINSTLQKCPSTEPPLKAGIFKFTNTSCLWLMKFANTHIHYTAQLGLCERIAEACISSRQWHKFCLRNRISKLSEFMLRSKALLHRHTKQRQTPTHEGTKPPFIETGVWRGQTDKCWDFLFSVTIRMKCFNWSSILKHIEDWNIWLFNSTLFHQFHRLFRFWWCSGSPHKPAIPSKTQTERDAAPIICDSLMF